MIGAPRFTLPAPPVRLRFDLPLQQDASGRFLPWIIALMVYLAAIGGVGLIWLGEALDQWDISLTSTLTVQIPADASQPRMDMAVGALRQTRGVISARLLPPEETAKLLQPWLGNNVTIADLPLPRLIDVRVDPRTTIDYPTLRSQLASVIPGSQLDNSPAWLGSVRDSALRIEGVITAGVLAIMALIVMIVVFTARIGLSIHRSLIELLHLLGARDAYIARQFQIHALSLGLRGGLIGAIAAALTVVFLGPAAHIFAVPVVTYSIFDWRVWLLLITACLAAGGVAMLTARITVLRQLARMP